MSLFIKKSKGNQKDCRKVHFERLGYAVLLLKHKYLCVNSALHYLRPPLRGLKPCTKHPSTLLKTFRIISPLRGRKQHSNFEDLSNPSTLELLPRCGDWNGIKIFVGMLLITFRITTPLRGLLNDLSLLCNTGYE